MDDILRTKINSKVYDSVILIITAIILSDFKELEEFKISKFKNLVVESEIKTDRIIQILTDEILDDLSKSDINFKLSFLQKIVDLDLKRESRNGVIKTAYTTDLKSLLKEIISELNPDLNNNQNKQKEDEK